MASQFGTVQLAHEFLAAHVKEGDLCIDCTAGRGNDTAFLCGLVGESGKVLAFDIQPDAVKSTNELLEQRGFSERAEVFCESHSEIDKYADEGTVAAIVFNFGWLPGGDHSVNTRKDTSIEAVEKGLRLLKPDGVMSLSIYYGRDTGYEERDALLKLMSELPVREYTALVSRFVNRPNEPPISVRIYKGR
ncbi:Putative rRNA methylase [Ruminococcus sp. YE71]|uniref:class I SAM-dependent methyltransferase n=1 Tax=unclassified Ruminococcus TaxID=2608920 RepID=UPI0008839626|nr:MULTISPECIES: class I SAM-dependent methyltransferase [unclassified Ruminococcus]SDA19668.1 Putative rRNA methylase [Ruminococcus sp. YE78]SFW31152.1 Putative rRNA methylase [Ruminococcus sp. YE71]